MEFAKGQYVVYNGTEICRIGEKVLKNFDGVNESEYFSLFPNDSKVLIMFLLIKSTSIYVLFSQSSSFWILLIESHLFRESG